MHISKKKLKTKVFRNLSIPYYNVVTSNDYNYTWFKVAKNGTRSILKVLREQDAIDMEKYDYPYFKKKHVGKFKFCVIRNPWDRLTSCYAGKVVKQKMFQECWDKDFDYFVDFITRQDLNFCNAHFRRQTRLFPVGDIDYMARMENYGTDIEKIMTRLGIETEIAHLNRSNKSHYTEYYNDKTIKVISELYKDDIELGKYKFGE
ncbi:sulfotransferase family 2 domain-containing protein [uncultured Draconibacterium sp.]|uniref:sulfotransferase family 2 domain-containing protein n=1 Tax=uncultured Draconibacterium sp. TaxID=1573823 RepID=UPI002AA852CD|nr:sulfotransferase family 2 domain-containing protein [uncultured Draconibacterium sp.]